MSNIIGGGAQIPILNSSGNRPTMESQMAAVIAAKAKALNSIMNDKALMDVYSQLVVNVECSVEQAFANRYGAGNPRINSNDVRSYSELILTDIFSKLPV